MATVYKITDNTTGKVYIGVTKKRIEQRLSSHFYESRKPNRNHRKLYRAINQAGEANFSIEKIEDCSDDVRFERERYWIAAYNSFESGYNDTFGGSGRNKCDYQVIAKTYKEVKNIKQTAELLGIDVFTVKSALDFVGVSVISNAEVVRNSCGKKVCMFDLNGQYQQSFLTLKDAAIAVSSENFNDIDGVAAHIGQVCSGKRKTAYKHRWAFDNKGA